MVVDASGHSFPLLLRVRVSTVVLCCVPHVHASLLFNVTMIVIMIVVIAKNNQAGGDQASRGMFVGAVLGAVGGLAAIPQSWKAQYLHYDEMEALAEQVLSAQEAVAKQ